MSRFMYLVAFNQMTYRYWRSMLMIIIHQVKYSLDTLFPQSIPLSLFKVFPFAFCGPDDKFEQCPTSLNGRKVPRKTLDGGKLFFYSPN